MIHQAIRVHGKLVEIEVRGEYRTAFVLDGRHVIELNVGTKLEGNLDEHMGQPIVGGCIYSTRWVDTSEGRRPTGRLTLVAIEREPVAAPAELHEAA
jgi:hypothetical protein